MTARGESTEHWSEEEQKLLWELGSGMRANGWTWAFVAKKVSAARRVERSPAACARFFKMRLAGLREFPVGGVRPVTAVVSRAGDKSFPGIKVIVVGASGEKLSTTRSSRTLNELMEFITAPAARSKENGHGRGSERRNTK